ncbi:early nodulin-like protein 1 [Typha latifolia]|uniref:early nodulin-like protein 1 n=1 Tax=Typha latifolia TaxID=4733 RepID=UPI003C2E8EC6
MASKATFLLIFMALMASAEAHVFYVGGRDGWVVDPSESYNHWATRNRFQVNDTLVFKYKKGEDSVLVVNEVDFDACNVSNPIQRLDGGDSAFKLDRPGRFFFVSGDADQCRKAEKLLVAVMAVRTKQPIIPPSPSTSPPPSSYGGGMTTSSPPLPPSLPPYIVGLSPAPSAFVPEATSSSCALSMAVGLLVVVQLMLVGSMSMVV